ncbi:5167_t:CDS:1 [Ambispora gerdemannii]|uniref:5167_t:CDS:1 n=1 Tax=Ambispora gerdemannii TaxID=144530 RepID=A0A9N9E5R4_9GLOM|nr:5167_t:CDS:1 [Ambispora gerdemannii]
MLITLIVILMPKVIEINPNLNDVYETTENTCNETDTESQSDDNTLIASILSLSCSIFTNSTNQSITSTNQSTTSTISTKREKNQHAIKNKTKDQLILSQFARKYLTTPATSVSSERLFSDVGNLITPNEID